MYYIPYIVPNLTTTRHVFLLSSERAVSTMNTLQLVLQPYQDKSNGQPQSIASYCSNAGRRESFFVNVSKGFLKAQSHLIVIER